MLAFLVRNKMVYGVGPKRDIETVRRAGKRDKITTTLEREWFAQIVDRSKRVEYRTIKPYWTKRLAKVRTPFRLVLRNGMNPPIPVLTVRIIWIVVIMVGDFAFDQRWGGSWSTAQDEAEFA